MAEEHVEFNRQPSQQKIIAPLRVKVKMMMMTLNGTETLVSSGFSSFWFVFLFAPSQNLSIVPSPFDIMVLLHPSSVV
jgi:hypothetical protein